MYVYRHHDGRQAGGKDAWEAMRRALGEAEAHAVCDSTRSYDAQDGTRTHVALVTADGDEVGTVRELY